VVGCWLQYFTDTLPGSSGSPVFDASWDVIAVHRAGGTLVKNAKGESVYANEGVVVRSFSSDPELTALMMRLKGPLV
jgi:V8-like Glu-specific endopeptidase